MKRRTYLMSTKRNEASLLEKANSLARKELVKEGISYFSFFLFLFFLLIYLGAKKANITLISALFSFSFQEWLILAGAFIFLISFLLVLRKEPLSKWANQEVTDEDSINSAERLLGPKKLTKVNLSLQGMGDCDLLFSELVKNKEVEFYALLSDGEEVKEKPIFIYFFLTSNQKYYPYKRIRKEDFYIFCEIAE